MIFIDTIRYNERVVPYIYQTKLMPSGSVAHCYHDTYTKEDKHLEVGVWKLKALKK